MAMLSPAFVLVAALFWGLAGGIGGILMTDGWAPFVVSFYRGAIGLLFFIVWLAVSPRGSGLASGRLWLWSTIAGLGITGNFAFYFISISESSVAVAATLMYCAPVFVYLASFALKLERPTATKWVAIALVMLGVGLLTRVYETGPSGITLIGAVSGLLAGLSYAVFIFGLKYAAPHGSPQAILVVAFATLAAILVWPSDADQTLAALSAPSWPLFAAFGLLGAGLSFTLYIFGLKRIAPAVASIMAMVEPVTASLFGVVLLDESLGGGQILGIALILATVTALSVSSSARKPSSEVATF